MTEYTLSAYRTYYEYIFKAKGHTALESSDQISLFSLQGLTGAQTLGLIKQEEKIEQRELLLNDLKHKRYFLLGRHQQSHQELHHCFLKLGLKKVTQANLIQKDDFIFVGQCSQDSTNEFSPRQAWLVSEHETNELYEHVQKLIVTQESQMQSFFEQSLSQYLDYPLLNISTQTLSDFMPLPYLEKTSETYAASLFTQLRLVILGSKAIVGAVKSSVHLERNQAQHDIEVRWSSAHLHWANTVIILWRGHKAQDLEPFGLSMESLIPLLSYAQNLYAQLKFLLICPEGMTTGKKRSKLIRHQEVWQKWHGHNISFIELNHGAYDALDQGQFPSADVISVIQNNLERSNDSQGCSQNYSARSDSDFSQLLTAEHHFGFRLISPVCFELKELTKTAQLLTRLGLISELQMHECQVSCSQAWVLAQPLSQQTLADALGEYSVALLHCVGQLSEDFKQEDFKQPQTHLQDTEYEAPILLKSAQAILLCDLLNLCFNLNTIYLEKTQLVGVIKSLKHSKPDLKNNHRQLAQIKLKPRQSQDQQKGFRLLSHIERELLEKTDHIQKKKDDCYSLKGDLLAWHGIHEWTHDDFFYWGLSIETHQDKPNISDAFWASILNAGPQLRLGQVSLQKCYDQGPYYTHKGLKKSKKTLNHDLGALRLIFQPGQ